MGCLASCIICGCVWVVLAGVGWCACFFSGVVLGLLWVFSWLGGAFRGPAPGLRWGVCVVLRLPCGLLFGRSCLGFLCVDTGVSCGRRRVCWKFLRVRFPLFALFADALGGVCFFVVRCGAQVRPGVFFVAGSVGQRARRVRSRGVAYWAGLAERFAEGAFSALLFPALGRDQNMVTLLASRTRGELHY